MTPVTITPELVAALKAGAEAATQDDWETRDHAIGEPVDIYAKGKPDTLATTAFHGWSNYEMVRNASHIARCDPPTITALCDDWFRIRAALEAYQSFVSKFDKWQAFEFPQGEFTNDEFCQAIQERRKLRHEFEGSRKDLAAALAPQPEAEA